MPRAPARPVAKRLPGWIFENTRTQQKGDLIKRNKKMRLALGAALLAVALFALMTAPGL